MDSAKVDTSKHNTLKKQNTKKVYLEILRCIAIFFVIFNHTGVYGYQLFANTQTFALKLVYMVFSVICKSAVPIFFIISGALLLGKDEDLKKLFKKRILRMVLVILIASFGQYLYKIRNDFGSFNLLAFFEKIYTDRMIVPYWFLYSYTAFLFMLPFLRSLVKNLKREYYYYLFGIYFIYKLIMPIFAQVLNINVNSYLAIAFLETNILCPIIGYYLEKAIDLNTISKKAKIFATILLVLIIAIAITLTIFEGIKTGNPKVEKYLSYGSVFIALYIYAFVKITCDGKTFPRFITGAFILLGSCSFGIYLIEARLRTYMLQNIIKTLSPYITKFPASIVCTICILTVGTVIIFVLKKIPGIKKLI